MNKNAKFMMKMGVIGIAVFLVYLAIPKINVVQSAVQLELERYEYYIPLEILETYVLEDSELYIQNNLGFRKIAMDEPFALENDTTLKIVQPNTQAWNNKPKGTLPAPSLHPAIPGNPLPWQSV